MFEIDGIFKNSYNSQKHEGERMAEEFLTVEEVAKRLHLQIYTIRKYIRTKQLRAYKFGREYRIKKEDYDRFVEQHQTDKENDWIHFINLKFQYLGYCTLDFTLHFTLVLLREDSIKSTQNRP